MSIPFSLAKAIKLKVAPRFPSLLLGGTGIGVVQANGNYTVNIDYSQFGITSSVPLDPLYTLIYDGTTKNYLLLPLSVATGGIGEAPIDGTSYARKNAAWASIAAGSSVSPSTNLPFMDGTAAVGISLFYTREDHVHPSDTTRAPLVSPTFTGTPAAPTPTAGTNTTQIATTAFVATSFAPLASPGLTGTPTAPTAVSTDNSTTIATTAFVKSVVNGVVPENAQSANYTTVLSDAGKFIHHPSSDANARTFTIASNASVAYTLGTVISFTNLSANAVTIAIATDTMYLAGPGTTGSRTLAQYGCATALKTDTTTWIISGTGLT